MSRNLVTRIAVAAVAIPAILWICYQGGLWLFGLVTLLAVVGMLEFLRAEQIRLGSLPFILPLVTLLAALLVTSLSTTTDGVSAPVLHGPFYHFTGAVLLGYFFITSLLFALRRLGPAVLFTEQARLWWGTAYLALLYPFVYALGQDHLVRLAVLPAVNGDLLLFLFGVLWVGDTTAMWVGSSIGRHKLAPEISPNKTVEGFFGGIAGSLLIGVIMAYWKFNHLPIGHVLAMAGGVSVCGQLGDLSESLWKRSLGIKDSSAIVPGHGGVLDRFDSLLYGAPFVYAYVILVL